MMAYTQMGHQANSSEADGEFYELLKYNEAILLNLPEILVVVDNSGRVRLVNESGRSFFGPALSSELPLPVATFFGENNALLEGLIDDSSASKTGRTHHRARLDSKSGKVVADVSVIPILDGEYRIGTIIVVADVTEQESMREQLLLSEKLASVGLLAAGVAHEINNPLEILKNNVNLIRMRERDAEAFGLLDELDEELQSIRYITESLVNFCDGSSNGYEDFDLVELVWSLIRLVKKNAEERLIRIEFERDKGSRIIVCANRNEIRQVLLNLYKNSCDAMPDGGSISIRIDECSSDGRQMARLAFLDSGCGFSEENANDLFLPFYTTKKDKHNLGLGLSLSYSIITKYNGTLRATNLEPSGCQFTIELPMQPSAAGS
jgi:signal transduction histidine kinase